MGQSPEVPEHLSEEGKNFLASCFVHNPEERAAAQALLSHNFTKVREALIGRDLSRYCALIGGTFLIILLSLNFVFVAFK